jgi:hypothetical protein
MKPGNIYAKKKKKGKTIETRTLYLSQKVTLSGPETKI